MLGAFLGRCAVDASKIPVGRGLVQELVTALIGALVLMALARAFADPRDLWAALRAWAGRLLRNHSPDARDGAKKLATGSTEQSKAEPFLKRPRGGRRRAVVVGTLASTVLAVVTVRRFS